MLSTLSLDGDFVSFFGEQTAISCNIVTGDTDFHIIWKIDEVEYTCIQPEMDPNIECTNDIILQIQNTTFLGVGNHDIQCILQPNIQPDYKNDPSFQSHFNDNITNTVTLTIIGK